MIAMPPVGSVLAGRYELIRHIARGGMGDVYEAEDRQLARRVAVKVFRAAAAGDRDRFDAEVVILAALNHPGLVRVYDAGEQDGDAFVVLELVEGPTLASRLANGGRPSSTEVAELGAQLADALDHVHSNGVVHRDVTPSNVLCGPDGRARLADFGIARLVDTTRVTAAATTVGTAAYMAPEQVQGREVTPAADVYALGLVLLELLTGRQAFVGSPQEVAMARLVRNPDTETGVPRAWHGLLSAMTGRSASSRPSAAEVRDALRAIAVSTPTGGEEPASVRAVVVDAPDGTSVADDVATRAILVADRTMAMPAGRVPVEESRRGGRRRVLVAAVLGLMLLIVGVAIASALAREPDTPSTVTTEPLVPSTSPTSEAPVSTAPVTPAPTEAPSEPGGQTRDGPGNGKDNDSGKGKGKGG
jgi:serine/threonine protein kinase